MGGRMSQPEDCDVYLIRNTITGKVYVGQTSNFKIRWRNHKTELRRGAHGNRYIQRAWNKYGEGAFEFSVLQVCPENLLNLVEEHYIHLYGSFDRDKGYNLITEIRGRKIFSADVRAKLRAARKGWVWSDEAKAKMSDSARKRAPVTASTRIKMSISARNKAPMSQETRNKLSQALQGREFSDETRAKISLSKKGKRHTQETKRSCLSIIKVERSQQMSDRGFLTLLWGILYQTKPEPRYLQPKNRSAYVRRGLHVEKSHTKYGCEAP